MPCAGMRTRTTFIPSMSISGTGRRSSSREERNTETLQYTVRKVYSALKDTEDYISRRYNYIEPLLPDDICFITSQELEDMSADSRTPKERENLIARAKGAVFVSQISAKSSLPVKNMTDAHRTMMTGS